MKHKVMYSILAVLMLFSMVLPSAFADNPPEDGPRSGPSRTREEAATVDEQAVKALAQSQNQSLDPAGTTATSSWSYRHYWGYKRGLWTLRLNSSSIRSSSRVFVSVHECGHVGSANYQVFNVVPYNYGVAIRVNINWSSAVPLCADYFIVNP